MVLRPVLWLGLAYITGEALDLLGFRGWPFIILLLLAETGIILNITGRLPMKKYSRDVWLLVLPFFIAFGFYNCWQATQQALKTDGAIAAYTRFGGGELPLSGKVTGVEEKTGSWYIYVKDCQVTGDAHAYQGPSTENLPMSSLLVVTLKREAVTEGAGQPPAAVDDRIAFCGLPESFDQPVNEGMFDEWLYFHARNVQARVFSDTVTVLQPSGNCIAKLAQGLGQLMKQNCRSCLSEKSSGVAISMVTGDKSELDADLKKLYQLSGIAHILAISGLHISFLGMGTYNFLRRLRLPVRLCMVLGLLLTVGYGLFTGMAPSTQRAVIMTSMAIVARAVGYTYDRKTALGIAALAILIPEPLQATQPGFLLSFVAVGSLAMCEELLKALSKAGGRVSRWLGRTLAPGVCVTLGMMPVMAWSFYELPSYSFLLNLIVIPLMSVLYPAMLVCALVGGVAGAAGVPLYFLIDRILDLYDMLCRFVLGLPGSVIIVGKPTVLELAVIYGGLIIIIWIVRYKDRYFEKTGEKLKEGSSAKIDGTANIDSIGKTGRTALSQRAARQLCWQRAAASALLWLVALGCTAILFLPRRPGQMTVTMLDVGQGDCLFIQLPTGENILVDGGSTDVKNVGIYRLIPLLKCRGVRQLDAVFLSHMDKDHINAVEELFQARIGADRHTKPSVGASADRHKDLKAWGGAAGQRPAAGTIAIDSVLFSDIAPWPRAAGNNYASCLELAKAAAGQCYVLKTGDVLRLSGLTVNAIQPSPQLARDTNDSSLVLYMAYGSFSMLFTGDISDAVDTAVMENLDRLGMDGCAVLKVAHHGAKSSTSERLLDYLKPSIALISCGQDNSYGHPHKELLERLEERGIQTMITARYGEIIVKTDGERLSFYGFKTPSG